MVVRLADALLLCRRGTPPCFLHSFSQFHVFVWVARGVWSLSVPSLKPQCSGVNFPAWKFLVESGWTDLLPELHLVVSVYDATWVCVSDSNDLTYNLRIFCSVTLWACCRELLFSFGSYPEASVGTFSFPRDCLTRC